MNSMIDEDSINPRYCPIFPRRIDYSNNYRGRGLLTYIANVCPYTRQVRNGAVDDLRRWHRRQTIAVPRSKADRL